MARPPTVSRPAEDTTRILDGGFWLVVALSSMLGVLVLASVALGTLGPSSSRPDGGGIGLGASASPAPNVDLAAYLYPTPRSAPPITLIDPDDRPFSLASLRGTPTFVFFGYTHCPDVCPATIGTVGLAMEAYGSGPRAVFVTVDPERDTTSWLREYTRFLPTGFTALTGPGDRIRSTADAWGIRYARVETGTAGDYAMSHTADVFLVDAGGMLRAHLPFGTSSEAMTAVLRSVVASPGPAASTASATPAASTAGATPPASAGATPPTRPPTPTAALGVEVVSSSVWAGPPAPVILALSVDGVRLDDPTLAPMVQLLTTTGARTGPAVTATPVRPPGLSTVSYVATLPIPRPGSWRLEVTARVSDGTRAGTVALDVLDPGTTPAIGGPAPTVRTPTLADVGGIARAVTTDPAPDLRLSRVSTVDALGAQRPFVLVVDSTRFRVSPACGRAIIMARYLLDRWPDMAFIHLEPYRYSVVADTAVLDGSLDAPMLTDPAATWGIGGAPWGPRSMPWVFVVDGRGVVRATYQGVMGTGDVDVILALIAQGD